MGAIEDLTAQLDAIAGDEQLSADERGAALTSLRERINDVVGYADRLRGGFQRRREGEAQAHAMAGLEVRENADLHDRLVEEGADPAELEEGAVLSHRTLDELEEEGLGGEAVERVREELGG